MSVVNPPVKIWSTKPFAKEGCSVFAMTPSLYFQTIQLELNWCFRISCSPRFATTVLVNKDTAWKVSKYGVFSGPYFLVIPVFSLNTGKYGTEKTPYLDNFHTVGVIAFFQIHVILQWCVISTLHIFLTLIIVLTSICQWPSKLDRRYI